MRASRWIATTLAAAMALAAPATLGAAVPAQAAPAAAKCTQGPQPPVQGPTSTLYGIAVVSTCDAWAVGVRDVSVSGQNRQRTLVEHWNGKDWIPVASPNPINANNNDYLIRATAISSTDVWAVGITEVGSQDFSLIEHYNGKKWRTVASANPGGKSGSTELDTIWAASPTDVWAAGAAQSGSDSGIIEHWNGHKWSATIPTPKGATAGTSLNGIAGSSRSQVWAVGSYCASQTSCVPVIYGWNGKKWQESATPAISAAANGAFSGVTVQSKDSAWAVGYLNAKSGKWELPLVEHWNGHIWRRVAIPAVQFSYLNSVAYFSPHSAVAIGTDEGSTPETTLILTWNGSKWVRQPNQHPFGTTQNYNAYAVAGSSCSTAWIVGAAWTNAQFELPLAVHC